MSNAVPLKLKPTLGIRITADISSMAVISLTPHDRNPEDFLSAVYALSFFFPPVSTSASSLYGELGILNSTAKTERLKDAME
jgi:hypothetical protein